MLRVGVVSGRGIKDRMQTDAVARASWDRGQKPHFLVLDGLRGVAAICVVIFHSSEMVIWDYSKLWIGHGYLAVDFFFCLSGFVIGYAYDDRMARIGLGSFVKARLIRLHPMVVLGSVLGVIGLYVNPFTTAHSYGPGAVMLLVLASIFLVPYGVMPERGRNLFGLNAPAWSLFWEYVASLIFGLGLYRLGRRALATLVFVTAVVLCWTGSRAGNLSGGWNAHNFWDGGARVAFSFPAGLLVFRMGWRPRTRVGFFSLSALLLAAVMLPYARGAWMREAAVIVLGFPLLVALGAGASVKPAVERLCRVLGELSYPLYMTHYALMWLWGDWAAKHQMAGARLWCSIAVGVLLTVAFAWAVLLLYDEPLRAWLRRRWLGARAR